MKSKRQILLDGQIIGLFEAEARFGIKADVIWLRVKKLGWTPRQAVGLDEYSSRTIKGITYRGKKYVKQEDLYKEYAEESPRSITTMRIAMAALRNSGEEITDERIDEVIFGGWEPDDKGGFLYKLTCKPSGKTYIGITSRPQT